MGNGAGAGRRLEQFFNVSSNFFPGKLDFNSFMCIGNTPHHRVERQRPAVDLPGILTRFQLATFKRKIGRFHPIVFIIFGILIFPACGGQDPPTLSATEATAEPSPTTGALHAIPPTAVPSETAEIPTPTLAVGTAEPTETPTPQPTPTNTPVPIPVNGIPVESFIKLPENVREHMTDVFVLGQEMGRDPTAFSILGDSTVLNPQMLGRFDGDNLDLDAYDYLQPVVDHFSAYFGQYGVAARHGLHSWSIFDPLWADKKWCFPNETLLACEFRLRNPSVLIIRLGSNDAGSPDGFRYNIRKAIEFCLENGVMPVIATKADRFEGSDNTNNIILRELAETYEAPLWDFDVVAETLPERGLDTDGIHMVEYLPNDYSQESAFESGHAVQDLTGLMMLYALWQDVIYPNRVQETAENKATPTEAPVLVNGVPVDSIVVLPDRVKQAMAVVFYEGQAVGRSENHFSKIGDSLIATPSSLTLFDLGPYNLGDYDYLEPVIDFFEGSFSRYGVGIKTGMRSWSLFDPEWADPEWCEPDEGPVACEIRLHNPAVMVVVVGSNDNSEAVIFDENMRQMVEYATSNGVIPILVTKADRYEGGDNRNNNLLRAIAVDFDVPLVDFDLVADTLPNRGLGEDNVHLSASVEGNFLMPQGLETGYGTHNLVILMGLYAVWQEVIAPAEVVYLNGTQAS
jgi:hypothetical protein